MLNHFRIFILGVLLLAISMFAPPLLDATTAHGDPDHDPDLPAHSCLIETESEAKVKYENEGFEPNELFVIIPYVREVFDLKIAKPVPADSFVVSSPEDHWPCISSRAPPL